MLEKLFKEGLPDYSDLEEVIEFPNSCLFESIIEEVDKRISRNQIDAYIESAKVFFS